MKYIINENKINNLLRNLLSENGLDKTLTITGLNVFQLFDKIGFIPINPDMSYVLIYHIFRNYDDELTKKIGDYTLEFNFDGVMEWNYKNKKTNESMYALCTPYWDGNSFTPIDCEYYIKYDFEFSKDDEDDFYFSFKCPNEFNSLMSLMSWYEEEYIPTVYNKLNEFLEKYRNIKNEYRHLR
jgi:hypothetical protein